MPPDLSSSSLEAAALLAAGVIPRIRKQTADSWDGVLAMEPAYNPRTVHVGRATGGFNTAVQVSAASCLRLYADQIGDAGVTMRYNAIVLRAALDDLAGKLSDPYWAALAPDPKLAYGFGLDLAPVSLAFSNPHSVSIRFEGALSLLVEAPYVHALAPTPSSGGASPAGTPIGELDPGGPATPPGVLDPVHDPDRSDVPMRPLRRIGALTLTLTAPYGSTSHAPQRSVDIWLGLDKAVLDIAPEAGDTQVLFERFVAPKIARLKAVLMPVGQLPLAPTVSLAGRNPAGSSIDELAGFDVRVFHVASGSRQAICAAFDVVPGCQGIVEDVQHFIGRHDYGVIHDEYVVERVLRHKWKEGGFDRSLALAHTVALKVKRDGEDRIEDAWVYGRMELATLDLVALTPHADLRLDVLSLGGQARAIAERVVLGDGTVLTPENADLGPAQDTFWAVDVNAATTAVPDPDPELRSFQEQAHRDGLRHLARPFARFPIGAGLPQVEYARTEAVLKRMFFLGRLGTVFF